MRTSTPRTASNTLRAVIAAAVWLVGCAGSTALAAPGPLRLGGSFIQYWDEMQAWPPDTWRAVLDKMKEAGMRTVIIQMLAFEQTDGSIRSYLTPSGQTDATDTILGYADTNGFQVFLGLYMPNWNHDMLGAAFLLETQSRMAAIAQQAWDRYLSGDRHASFAGWYLPYEPWTADYQPAEVSRLRSFFQSVDAACRQAAGDRALAISPFINSTRASPCRVEHVYGQLLDQSGLDIVLLQDSVGAQQWDTGIPQRVAPYYEAFRNACEATGVRLWANLESFQISGSRYEPCDAARLKKQFEGAGAYVDEFVTFDFVHYMNPVAFLSGWDEARRTRMQQLYADYKAAFVDADYAPFARPALSARAANGQLLLDWRGAPEDGFEVQVTTNLAAAAWIASGAPVGSNGSSFSMTEPLPEGGAPRWYRVRRLPRLHVPDSMVYVAPGAFVMGTPTNDPARTANELSPFQVTLSRGFWMSRYEVTQSEYQNLLCTNPASVTGDLERPVDRVPWRSAMDYCALLTAREREALRLPDGFVYRLPTEAEWEYAARSGTTNRFAFGDEPDELPSHAWYDENSGSSLHPVGQRQPSVWGLNDIHGNAFEWCWDWIGSAPTGPAVDFRGGTNEFYHAIRGGAASYPWTYCRAGWRTGYSVLSSPTQVGFRVVLAEDEP